MKALRSNPVLFVGLFILAGLLSWDFYVFMADVCLIAQADIVASWSPVYDVLVQGMAHVAYLVPMLFISKSNCISEFQKGLTNA